MNKITLYSNLYYDSGVSTSELGFRDQRWHSHSDDSGGYTNPYTHQPFRKLLPCQKVEPELVSYVFNSVGIECAYTYNRKDKDAVRLVDIGSDPDWLGAARACARYFNGQPFILFSSQEPCTQIVEIYKAVPQAFIMDITYGEKASPNHIPFPSFFTRMLNPFFNIVIGFHVINLAVTSEKQFIYNNLKFRNDAAKAITQYFLYANDLLDKGLVTYNRDKGIFSKSLLPVSSKDPILTAFLKMFSEMDAGMKERYSKQDFKDWYSRQNNMELPIPNIFAQNKRYHPITVYNETYFSMINESPANNNLVLFTEKSLYPILQGHPFIVNNGNQTSSYKYLQELGFDLFDEILDYPSDSSSLQSSILNCVSNIENFDRGAYERNIENITKTSRHNRQNFLNTHSTLWKTLRKLMNTNLEQYFDACNN
jgi:hypothetical protein